VLVLLVSGGRVNTQVVHFAEQRAAPYSMRSPKAKRYTVDNNLGGTHNLMCAVVESGLDIHVVHLGTMGVYGYGTSGGEIPEGYLDVTLPGGRSSTILHPAYPGSIYHATKCLDALLFQFYNKNDGLRCTDLHQGVVWGTNTAQTARDERLVNRFDYDGDYGTVLNRFLMQAWRNAWRARTMPWAAMTFALCLGGFLLRKSRARVFHHACLFAHGPCAPPRLRWTFR